MGGYDSDAPSSRKGTSKKEKSAKFLVNMDNIRVNDGNMQL